VAATLARCRRVKPAPARRAPQPLARIDDDTHQVQAEFLSADMPGVDLQASFDLVLGGAEGTPAG